MSLFSWLRPAGPILSGELQLRLQRLPTATGLSECSLREQRWVVLDLETTGLNLNKDRVLSIGAVVIEDGAIDFSQQFERTLQCTEVKLGPSVLIHASAPARLPPAVTRRWHWSNSWSTSVTARSWPSMRRSTNTCSAAP